jgi:hypothetical protein
MARAMSRAPLWMLRGTLRAGSLKQQRCLRRQTSQSYLAGAVEELVVVHDRALAGQHFAGRTDIDVPSVVVGEVLARERPIGSFGLVGYCAS